MSAILAEHPRLAPALVAGAAALALLVAFASQYLGGLAPCVLCIWQRWPYGVAIALGILGLAVAGNRPLLRAVLILAGLTFLVDAGIAAFHVGVEQGWWEGTAECVGSISPAGMSIEDLARALNDAPVVRCDEVPWSFAGISIAGFNFLFAALCGLATLWAAARLGPRPRATTGREPVRGGRTQWSR